MRYHSGIDRFICILFAGLTLPMFGQFPGGVGEPLVWLAGADGHSDSRLTVQSFGTVPVEFSLNDDQAGHLNYHPLWTPGPIVINAEEGLASNSTYFIVYEDAQRSYEENLWSVNRNDTTRLVMTTRRFVDMDKGLYSNLSDEDANGQLKSYTHHRNQTVHGDVTLRLFSRPGSSNLPVVAADRRIAEMIIYDRALSDEERIRVETYLALKYGLSMKHPVNTVYLDSHGEAIWSEHENREFAHRVTAIGRDAHFDNRQSAHSTDAEPVSIALTKHAQSNAKNDDELSEGEWLVWSDDNGPLQLAESYAMTRPLARNWQMRSLTSDEHPAQVILDTRKLAVEPADNWWLQVESGSDLPVLFHGRDLESGRVAFDSVSWDQDHSGRDEFTFLPGGPLMPTYQITQPACGERSGNLSIQAFGGAEPYSYTIEGQDGSNITRTGQKVDFDGLEAGIYEVTIKDSDGLVWQVAVTLSNSHAPTHCLPAVVTLPGNDVIRIRPGDYCIASGASVEISGDEADDAHGIANAGEFFVKISEDGCSSVHRLLVKESTDSPIEQFSVFPNPQKSGDPFDYQVALSEQLNAEISLYDQSGKEVMHRSLGAGTIFNGRINAPVIPGTYTASISAGGHIQSTQLIVIE